MGANLVGRTFSYRAHVPVLSQTEFDLLVYMSLTALDNDTPPLYFDSRESSALALGRIVPDAVAPDDPRCDEVDRERTAAFQRVKVAIQGLVALGAIERVRQGGNGHRAEFAIVLNVPVSQTTDEYRKRLRKPRRAAPRRGTADVPLTPVDNPGVRTTHRPPRGTSNDSLRGTSDVPVGVRPAYPSAVRPTYPLEGTTEEYQEHKRKNITNASTSPEPVDNSQRAS
ncbi:hypothetical protein [Microbacterium allomyrinae]|uniref:Uncharacterized protein n=1 Tax=Microbacterium allomyrinae TaxID=2830666 RepID=A0A9X1S3P8_9MICO|nr:hypothetical protein [Microbacterium allomyrinae]MCC2032188.1 hypothetical protein [Microbacterium allomyrinae]